MPADLPKETWDLRKTDTGWAYVRTSSPVVPATQAPADDMPPIALMVLDSLADGDETIDTMRNCGEVEPYGLALVGEKFIFDALRSLLAGGLVEAIEIVEADDGLAPRHVDEPGIDDDHLRTYWYGMTAAGKAEWERGVPVLDAYCDAHPIGTPWTPEA